MSANVKATYDVICSWRGVPFHRGRFEPRCALSGKSQMKNGIGSGVMLCAAHSTLESKSVLQAFACIKFECLMSKALLKDFVDHISRDLSGGFTHS